MDLFKILNNHPSQKVALKYNNEIMTYGCLVKEVQKRSRELKEVSVLGLALDNSINWMLWDLAAIHSNVIVVPIPPFFNKPQITHLMKQAGITHLATGSGLSQTDMTVMVDHIPRTAKITFTSGSTGTPKGVCLPSDKLGNVATQILEALGQDYAGKHLSVLPLSILLENIAGVYTGLLAGATVQLAQMNKFGLGYRNLHAIIEASQATSIILVPELLKKLTTQTIEQGPLPNLKFIAVGGAKVDPYFIIKARSIGLPVYEGYGLSECGSVLSLNTPSEDKIGTVGKLLSNNKVSIVNGELVISNPGFLGYVNEPAPQIYSSGDLGCIEQGFLKITGRKKNILITSYGRNISPEWVESILEIQPEINQAIVYGDGQATLSALVSLTENLKDAGSIFEKANSMLPSYAKINQFRVVEPFTLMNGFLTGNGKLKRQAILNNYL